MEAGEWRDIDPAFGVTIQPRQLSTLQGASLIYDELIESVSVRGINRSNGFNFKHQPIYHLNQ